MADVEANGTGSAMLISASGLGKLLMLSERPSVKKLKDYVATVVVPTLRELGVTSFEELPDEDAPEAASDKAYVGLANGTLEHAFAMAAVLEA